jgi:photosystem II stability/assembly factor-like uncharacterized protein
MRILTFFLVFISMISCGQNTRNFTMVQIEDVFNDSISIRAIAPLDENRVWFAANNGRVGLIDGKTPKLASIKYEDDLLNFRAIASTSETVFVLSIANPGVLYKIGFNGEEATNIEEVYIEKGEKVFYDSMAFWNDKEGIAMGDPTNTCLSIIITRDGGDHWEKLSCDLLPEIQEGEAAFAASNSNIALYGDHVWIATGGKKARVFKSSDKGRSWEVFDTPILQGKSMTGIYSIDFYDENTGVVFGGNWENKNFNEGNKAVTNDGGKSWNLVSNGAGPGYRSSARFVPGSNGKCIVAVGSPGISFSYDRGENWKELSDEGFYAIEFVNDTLAFASGTNRISRLVFK